MRAQKMPLVSCAARALACLHLLQELKGQQAACQIPAHQHVSTTGCHSVKSSSAVSYSAQQVQPALPRTPHLPASYKVQQVQAFV
jgi:hypothetical protein